MVGEVGGVCPIDQIWRCIYPNLESLSIGDDHYPMVFIPNDLWVTELRAVGRDHGILSIFGEGIAIIKRIGYILYLTFGGVECVDCYNTIGLIGEETGCVVCVDDGRARENCFS